MNNGKPPKIAEDPVCGSIRKGIISMYQSAGSPQPERDWLYSRLVEAYMQMQQMDIALLHAANLADAIKPLIPHHDSVQGEQREMWQRVVNVVNASADHATKAGWVKETIN